jgi:hypothetical protein
MMRLLRGAMKLLRGAIGIGLTWALAWFSVGMILRLIVGPGADDLPFPIAFGIFGFLSGVTFSGVLRSIEGRRRFDQMSLGRFAGWGAVGGLLLSGILAVTAGPGGESLMLVPVFALAGAGSAAGTLALARKAEAPRLLDTGAPSDSSDGAPSQLR